MQENSHERGNEPSLDPIPRKPSSLTSFIFENRSELDNLINYLISLA